MHGQATIFPIDHIESRNTGDTNQPENLALTCPHGNAIKLTATEASDAETGRTVPLFHPRRQAWGEHFHWSPDGTGKLPGRADVRRATVECLRINDPDMLELRRLPIEVGLSTRRGDGPSVQGGLAGKPTSAGIWRRAPE